MRDSNRKPRVRVIIIHVTVYFFGIFFFFFISRQHSEGVVYAMTMREKVNEGDEGFLEKMQLGSDM
jgi:hypothetical protein